MGNPRRQRHRQPQQQWHPPRPSAAASPSAQTRDTKQRHALSSRVSADPRERLASAPVRSGDREGGFWTRTIRAPCHRTPPYLQGQACPQARKEETWYLRTRQGEGRGTHQRHRRVEKSRPLSASPSSHFKPYRAIPYPLAQTASNRSTDSIFIQPLKFPV